MEKMDKDESKIYISLDWEHVHDLPHEVSDDDVKNAVNNYYELFVQEAMKRYTHTYPLSYIFAGDWIQYVINNFVGKVPAGVETNNNTKIHTNNMNIGDWAVDAAIGKDYFSGECHFLVWGNTTFTIDTINR